MSSLPVRRLPIDLETPLAGAWLREHADDVPVVR